MVKEIPLDDLYREVILDHYRHPRCHSPVSNPDIQELGYNPLCGDEVTVQIRCRRNCGGQSSIDQVGIFGRGCSICTASGSILGDLIKGQSFEKAESIIQVIKEVMHGKPSSLEQFGDLAALEGVKNFPVRIKCALLPWMTLCEAMKKIKEKQS